MDTINLKKIKRQLFGFSFGPIVSAGIGTITIPLITWFILPTELGKASMFTLVQQLISLFLYLGLDQSFVREFNVEKEKDTLLCTSIILPLILSIIIGCIIYIAYKPISLLLFEQVNGMVIFLLVISFPFTVIKRFLSLLIRMAQLAKIYSLILILEKIFNLLFIFLFILFIGKEFHIIILANVFSIVLSTIILFIIVLAFKMVKTIKIDMTIFRTILHYGLPLIPTAIMIWVFNSIDKWSLRIWSTYAALGIYASAFRIAAIIKIIQTAFTTFWSPVAYNWHSKKVNNKYFDQVRETVTSLLTIGFCTIVVSRKLIMMILGKAYQGAELLLPFLLLMPVMAIISETTVLGIYFSKKTKYSLLISIIVALVNLGGNVLLVPQYHSLGASISTGFSYILYMILRTLISRKYWYKFNLHRLIINSLFIIALTSISLFNLYIVEIVMFIIIIIYNRTYISKMIHFIWKT